MTWAERVGDAVGWRCAPYEVDRDAVEEAVGVRLPDDYVDLAARFGEGSFGGLVHVLSGLPERQDSLVRRWWFLDLSDLAPYQPFRPGGSGLLPWGGSDRGDVYCWLADVARDPGGWPVVVKTADGVDDSLPNGFVQFPTSASEFLWRILFDHELAPLGVALAGELAFEPDDGRGGP